MRVKVSLTLTLRAAEDLAFLAAEASNSKSAIVDRLIREESRRRERERGKSLETTKKHEDIEA